MDGDEHFHRDKWEHMQSKHIDPETHKWGGVAVDLESFESVIYPPFSGEETELGDVCSAPSVLS